MSSPAAHEESDTGAAKDLGTLQKDEPGQLETEEFITDLIEESTETEDTWKLNSERNLKMS
jgi:hypothetical protein